MLLPKDFISPCKLNLRFISSFFFKKQKHILLKTDLTQDV